ncbi:MAG TPA: hypothetical protein VD965_06635 [Burkholderiales bacterium]|nr:hypothetical protein [Burkholderiales bacterium]
MKAISLKTLLVAAAIGAATPAIAENAADAVRDNPIRATESASAGTTANGAGDAARSSFLQAVEPNGPYQQ